MNISDYAKKYNPELKQEPLVKFENLHLIQCKKSDPAFAYHYSHHYPGSLGIIGRQFNYKIYYKKELIGIIGACSPPLLKLFNEFFDSENSLSWLNNNVFKIIKSGKNRGSQILKLFRERIFVDYFKKYNQFLEGLITFVKPPREGIIYKADNWTYLGMTEGWEIKARNNSKKRTFKESSFGTKKTPVYTGNKKHVFAIKFPERYRNKILNQKKELRTKK